MEFNAVRIPLLSLSIGCAAVGAASGIAAAADLKPGPRVAAIFAPAGQIVEWDFEPGVVVRAYWLPPYAGRHYFPTSSATPKLGRKESLGSSVEPKPARSFYREWSSPPPTLAAPALMMGPPPADASNQPSLK